jgi:DNA topoisomerase-2
MMIEPHCYYPILPLVLINGAEGIGTGWSTTILPHKVDDVIEAIRKRLKGKASLLPVGW